MSFMKYAAGAKHYGGGRRMPNIGPVSAEGLLGYKKRDTEKKDAATFRNAALRKLKAQQKGRFGSADFKRGPISAVFGKGAGGRKY